MAKRQGKKPASGTRNDRRPNGKAWKGGIAPIDRQPGDKGYGSEYKPINSGTRTGRMQHPTPNVEELDNG